MIQTDVERKARNLVQRQRLNNRNRQASLLERCVDRVVGRHLETLH
ncbi:hypothetical protein [Gloeobacter kilaueensis]|uniref:Uncharacterized protein n=1 Tax=Gloeobacter kilaueensis (strain ATCC BAA-2537 / CCAP 1431/1 / ULC 316 / JS1) TaxID=1183438 RepID=U5QM97_GLOK1|nr:hypothetical protein [Gloeobacter kilaueensis]AGY60036.1 hypothetical protein GKIL_3790 [Gloeobacter kilaueensis JS1]